MITVMKLYLHSYCTCTLVVFVCREFDRYLLCLETNTTACDATSQTLITQTKSDTVATMNADPYYCSESESTSPDLVLLKSRLRTGGCCTKTTVALRLLRYGSYCHLSAKTALYSGTALYTRNGFYTLRHVGKRTQIFGLGRDNTCVYILRFVTKICGYFFKFPFEFRCKGLWDSLKVKVFARHAENPGLIPNHSILGILVSLHRDIAGTLLKAA